MKKERLQGRPADLEGDGGVRQVQVDVSKGRVGQQDRHDGHRKQDQAA